VTLLFKRMDEAKVPTTIGAEGWSDRWTGGWSDRWTGGWSDR
jgi:hypothetical protein